MALTRVFFMFDGFGVPPNTFTRTGATGTYVDEDGVLQTAAADTLRIEHLDLDDDGVREPAAALLEAGGTNLVDSDDLTAWTDSGTPVVTASVSDPAGGSGAFTVVDDDGAAEEFILRTVTFTADADKSAVFVIRENTMPGSGNQAIGIFDSTASVWRLLLTISAWVDGEPTITATNGTLLWQRYIGNGYWAVYGEATGVVAANTNQARIRPAQTAAATGSIDVYRVNAYDATVPPSSVLDASEVLGVDFLQAPIGFSPADIVAAGGATFYSKWQERGTAYLGSTARYWEIGEGDDRISLLSTSADGLVGAHAATGGSVVASNSAGAAVSIGDTVEARAVVFLDGSTWKIQLHYSVNGASEVSATAATIGASLPTAWAEQDVTINSDHGGGSVGIAAHISHKFVGGVKTMDEMRNMEPALVIQNYAIPVSPGTLRRRVIEIGDKARTFDGTMRETIRSRVSEWEAETTPLELADRNKVLDALESSTQPQTVYGSAFRKRDGTLPNVFTRPKDSVLVQSHNQHRYTVSFMAEESS